MRKRMARRFPEENGDAENNDASVRGRGNEVFRRCAGDVEVLRVRARAMGTFDPEEERKAGEFGNIKRDAPFYEAAFHARLAEKLLENGFAIRRTDRDFEFASVSRELIEKFSKRTRLIEQLARERYAVLEAEARDLAKKTGMDFADAFPQVKGKLGAESREAKSVALLDPEEQLANCRAQMTPEERASLKVESVKGSASQNVLEGLALDSN